jgi:hypothetical protein
MTSAYPLLVFGNFFQGSQETRVANQLLVSMCSQGG